MRKPFYRAARKCWFVKGPSGEFIRLDPDETVAHQLWNRMLDAGNSDHPNATFLSLCEAFLAEHEHDTSPAEFERWQVLLTSFCNSIGSATVWRTITKGRVLKWLKEPKPGRQRNKIGPPAPKAWGLSRQRQAGSILKRVFRWAHNEGKIVRNPLAELKLEESESRVVVVRPEVHAMLIEHLRKTKESRPFALYLIASKCGARPAQIRNVTAENVFYVGESMIWRFDEHKTKKKTKKPLTVYLSPCLQTLTKILLASRIDESLFVNSDGQPWLKDTVCRKMERLREKLKLPDGVIAYAYRHTFATDALVAGVRIATLATLLGHTDTRMVAKDYGHLSEHHGHLIDAVKIMATHQHKISQPHEA
jgi:integrase